jgi:hypothetical protein
MKKIFYFMALMLTTVGFTACSDDEKDTASIISFATGSYSIGASVGDEVEVFGKRNRVDALAALAGTIPYELTCAVSKRVPRIYYRNGQEVSRELLLRF